MAKLVVPSNSFGVCVWQLEDGSFLGSEDNVFLSMEGVIGDRRVEERMRLAVLHYMGDDSGSPKWMPGARKVTNDEWDDQKARLLEGKIPDEVDEARQILGLS